MVRIGEKLAGVCAGLWVPVVQTLALRCFSRVPSHPETGLHLRLQSCLPLVFIVLSPFPFTATKCTSAGSELVCLLCDSISEGPA